MVAQPAFGLQRASDLIETDGRLLDVPDAFTPLIGRGLKLGGSVAITGLGATSLSLALASAHLGWTALVGLDDLGVVAAAELGLDLDRTVYMPAQRWLDVVAATVDAFDAVIVRPQTGHRHLRNLNARIRERDAVLLSIGGWPDTDLQLSGVASTWHGLGRGHGHLEARTLTVRAEGRRVGGRPRQIDLRLPTRDGQPCGTSP